MRMLRSFRLRIALLTSSLAGAVLLAFGVWTWTAVERVGMMRIDDDIGKFVHNQLVRPGPPPDWSRVEQVLASMAGSDQTQTAAFLALDWRGETIHESAQWPVAMNSNLDLPRPDEVRYPPPPPQGPPMEPQFVTLRDGGRSWRIGVFHTPQFAIALALPLEPYRRSQAQIRNALLIAFGFGLILIGIGSYVVAQRALLPVQLLGATAERITAKGLDARIPDYEEDKEFQRVIALFNDMLDRLEKSFHQASRFSGDASHELKTPLAVLQGMLEEGVQEAADGSPEQQRYARLLQEVQRLKGITRKLLLLSQADAGQLKISHERVNLSGIAEEVTEDIEVLAPHLRLEKEIRPNLNAKGDPDLLRQVVQNLATNAIRYNRHEGRIGVRLRHKDGQIKLSISNTGDEIPESERERIFERFYRSDKHRSREKGGAGLGLSLAREIARAHGGDLELEKSQRGITVFTLSLPRHSRRSEH